MDYKERENSGASYTGGYVNTRVFFTAGEVVRVKHAIDNRPKMLVQSVDKATMPTNTSGLLGVTCIWFTKNGEIAKYRFSTKDLEKC